jgi:uncharacterized ion transporter superfamily protein YfcC
LKSIRIPHAFIFLSGIILFCSLLTYIIPSGAYQRDTREVGGVRQTLIVPGSYRELPKHYSIVGLVLGDPQEGKASPVSLLGLFTSIPKGLNQAGGLIFFVLIIGAVLNLIRHTGTIDAYINRLMEKFQHSPVLLSFILFTAIALGASLLGMGQEFIPLVPLFLIISKRMGYDRVFGLALLLLPFCIGWATGISNPFNVQIAQQIAELPLGSGIGLRILSFLVCSTIGFLYLIRYGRRVKKDRTRSVMPDDPFLLEGELQPVPAGSVKRKHILIGLTALVLFSVMLYAVQTMGWGLVEMSGAFFTVGVCTILISGMSGDKSMKAFIEGLEFMIMPALLVGFARGIQVVLEEGQIIDTILFHSAALLEGQPRLVSVEGMYVFQTLLNFFIPSASGQALVSMPLMVPMSDLLGISRQTAVLAFIYGDGFSNLIIPTLGYLMAVLGIAGIPYEKWMSFVVPLYLILALTAGCFLAIAVLINY